MNEFKVDRLISENYRQKEKIRQLDIELAEVKEHSEANLMASTDLGMNSMGTNEALLMTITDIGMAIMDIQKQLDELKGDK